MNEMHEREGKQDLTREKKINLGRKSLGKRFREREKSVWGEGETFSFERDQREMRENRVDPIYKIS